MLISISLELLRTVEVTGRDRIRIGDLDFRVSGWDPKNRNLMLEPTIPAMPADGIPTDGGSAAE
jgi:hypothetical protein